MTQKNELIIVTWLILIITIPLTTFIIFQLLGEYEAGQILANDLAISGILQEVYNVTNASFFEKESKVFSAMGLADYANIIFIFSLAGVLIGIIIDVAITPYFLIELKRRRGRKRREKKKN